MWLSSKELKGMIFRLKLFRYVPFVGDSKRAMDEYVCSIFMGGRQTFVIHNTCEVKSKIKIN